MRVSAVIPFFNRTELLRRSIASVLAQTRRVHEIIVVDDRSPEDTSWLAAEFPTVQVVRLDKNGGPARARYHGVQHATGTHIATLDMDDFWYPDKLERQVAYAEKIGDARGVYAHLQWVEEGNGGSVRPVFAPLPGEPLGDYIYVRNQMIQANTFLIERQLYLELCRISEDKFLEDTEMVVVADARGHRVYLQNESLSHWNCTTDPRRISMQSVVQRRGETFRRCGHYLTPKAQAAFHARIMAPALIQSGDYSAAARYLAQALWTGALPPGTVFKIVLLTLAPGAYKRAAAWYHRLRFGPRGESCTEAEARASALRPS
jgi:glycosyltransferase involved in cell wall biosynthesis